MSVLENKNMPLIVRNNICKDPQNIGCRNIVKNPIFQNITSYYDSKEKKYVEIIQPTCLKCFHLSRKKTLKN